MGELDDEADRLERERERAEMEAARAENRRLRGFYRSECLARGRTRRLTGRLGWAVSVLGSIPVGGRIVL